MTKFVFALIALLAVTLPSFAGVDEGIRQDIMKVAHPKLYVAWKRAVEAEEGALGKPVSKERQMEIFAAVSDAALLAKMGGPPVAQAPAVVAPARTARYLADKPVGPATKPHLGSSYPGYWMLMAHNDGEEPKWIFVEDGVKRLFTKNHIDMTDEPYDGPDFKKVTVTVPKEAGAVPVGADPVAAPATGYPFQLSSGGGPGWGNSNGSSGNLGSGAAGFGSGLLAGLDGLSALGNLSNGTAPTATATATANNKLSNSLKNTSTNKNSNANDNSNGNGNANKNKNRLHGKNQQHQHPHVVKLPTTHRQHQ